MPHVLLEIKLHNKCQVSGKCFNLLFLYLSSILRSHFSGCFFKRTFFSLISECQGFSPDLWMPRKCEILDTQVKALSYVRELTKNRPKNSIWSSEWKGQPVMISLGERRDPRFPSSILYIHTLNSSFLLTVSFYQEGAKTLPLLLMTLNNEQLLSICGFYLIYLFTLFLILTMDMLRGNGGREKNIGVREKPGSVAFHTLPDRGPNPQPRYGCV